MALEHEEAHRHRRVPLLEEFVVAGDEFVWGEAVALGLGHLPPVDRQHVAVDPIPNRVFFSMGTHVLGNLALVVRELEVHAAAMDVEGAAQVFGAHDRALEVPAREADAPRRGPAHQVAVVRLLPEGEVQRVLLFVLAVQGARLVLQLVDLAAAQGPVVVGLGKLADVEVDAAVGLIGESVGDDLFDHADLLDDVSGGGRFNGRRQDVEHPHHIVEVVRVPLDHLHGLEVLEPGLLANLVFPVVGVARQVTDIGDVPDVAHLVSEVDEIPEDHVEGQEGPHIAEVNIAVHGRTTDVHAHVGRVEGNEAFLFPAQRIADVEVRGKGTDGGFGGILGVHVGAVSEGGAPSEGKYRKAKTGPHTWRTGLLGQAGPDVPAQSASSRMS